MKCPVCLNISEYKTLTEICNLPAPNVGEKLVRYVCPICEVVFGTTEMLMMSKEKLSKMYRKHYSSNVVDKREQGNLSITSLFDKIDIKKGQSCLNWGSGPATKLAHKARDEFGIDLYNYDPYADDGFGMVTKEENLSTYDFIISRNVIEHFQDPISDFLNMKKYLKINGVMLHNTPCYSYEYVRTKFHTFFFLGKSPYVLADKIGMIASKIDKDNFIYQ